MSDYPNSEIFPEVTSQPVDGLKAIYQAMWQPIVDYWTPKPRTLPDWLQDGLIIPGLAMVGIKF